MNYGTIDYRETHANTKGNPGLMLELVRQLIGQPVLFGAMSYPRELTLHFGNPVQFKGPKGSTLTEGSYVLGAVGSAWGVRSVPYGRFVFDNAGYQVYNQSRIPVIHSTSDEEIEKFLENLGGTIVRDVSITPMMEGYALRVVFSDGSLVEVFPTPDNYEVDVNQIIHPRPPDWELFTPYKRFLRVGPGFQWGYFPSDQPEAKTS